MSIELSWYLTGRILYARIDGAITDADDVGYDERVLEFLNEASQPVHILTDFSGLEMIQTEIAPRNTDNDGDMLRNHPNLGQIICFGGARNTMIGYLFPMHSWALKPCHERFETLDEALAHLCEIDPTLRPLLVPDAPAA